MNLVLLFRIKNSYEMDKGNNVWDEIDYMEYMESRTMPIINEKPTDLLSDITTSNNEDTKINNNSDDIKHKEYYVLSDYMK